MTAGDAMAEMRVLIAAEAAAAAALFGPIPSWLSEYPADYTQQADGSWTREFCLFVGEIVVVWVDETETGSRVVDAAVMENRPWSAKTPTVLREYAAELEHAADVVGHAVWLIEGEP
ncbi:hypothetical protein [Gordonia sp. NPDC003585]|uniref:hypothetical protein n=1 Tax=Gordonia sp. NPDC003585 TaxID=3154275 RepID=UPI0033B009DC